MKYFPESIPNYNELLTGGEEKPIKRSRNQDFWRDILFAYLNWMSKKYQKEHEDRVNR
ncbi:hypothetical protein AGMMS49992_18180 [Clostridia bacterium]|nr:hypothetical protein AGMMS49992_18180 [Clostridia bacterium]